ncbi:MAG TPA: hypothetical protein VME20_12205 [Acidimicrobiales bacterium]|nr:hypothetical protein [Acidimicrobiales bacterium]
MRRLQLKHYLDAAGVGEDKYLLVGVDPPRTVCEGAWILRPNQRDWEVLAWRPVRLAPSLMFLTEEQACQYVLDMLIAKSPDDLTAAAVEEVAEGSVVTAGAL